MVDRQEVMRLSFLPGKDQPVQMIRASSRPKMRFRELSSSDRRPEAVEELMQEAFSEPFDLVQGPLYRATVLRRGADDHLLVLAIHHAIADGWTLGAFVQRSVLRLRAWTDGRLRRTPCRASSPTAIGALPSALFGEAS